MDLSKIPTPETDALRAIHGDLMQFDNLLRFSKDQTVLCETLERRLTVAREALKRCDPGEHDYPIPSDPYDGAAFCEISVGDIRAIREALTPTAPEQ